MPASITTNVNEALKKLTPWLEDRLDYPQELLLMSSGSPEDTGFSNETLIINARIQKERFHT